MKISIHHLLPISLLLSIVPFIEDIAWPILALNVFVLIWYIVSRQLFYTRVFRQVRTKPFVKFALIIVNLALIAKIYGFHMTQTISIVLLISMLCLKLLEIKNDQDKRNIAIILYLQFFLVSCIFLSSQGILISLYSIFLVLLLSFLMLVYSRLPLSVDIPLRYLSLTDGSGSTKNSTNKSANYSSNNSRLTQLIKINFKIAVIAIPMTIVIFVLFPRIPGPLWTLPNLSKQATTGLSDSMYPGSVNSLSDSAEIVFRVDFKDKIPPAAKLYWRGPVLTQTDGFLWEQDNHSEQELIGDFSQRIQQGNQTSDYTITLEPQKQKWLFTLEMAESISSQFVSDAYLSNHMQFLVKHAISRVVQYQARSYTSFLFKASNQLELNQALLYPRGSNPKTWQLGQQWQNQAKQQRTTPETIVKQGLDYFVKQNFYYTRKPSLMVKNPADEFLFKYKRGFCEHFASSFVLLMRAAAIPARVVTGYQGMEYNKVGNYYLVRQSNAHAWAEVWLENKGWVRVDPTAVIPQDHIEADIFDYKKAEMGFLNLNYSDLQQLSQQLNQQAWVGKLLKQFKQSIDLMQYSWNNWILGYDQHKQQWLLALFGFSGHWKTLAILLVIIPVLIVIMLYYFQLVKKASAKDKLLNSYHDFLFKLEKKGLKLSFHAGPEALKQQSIKKFPEHSKQLDFIFNYYIHLRYGRPSIHYSLSKFRHFSNKFKIN
jgi:protein-glutamine gamma-glutamyltransferase